MYAFGEQKSELIDLIIGRRGKTLPDDFYGRLFSG